VKGLWRGAARSLAVEPCVDVILPKSPLASDPDCWNLARLDQPVDGTQINLQIRKNFFGR